MVVDGGFVEGMWIVVKKISEICFLSFCFVDIFVVFLVGD